jgi:cell division protein FtsN
MTDYRISSHHLRRSSALRIASMAILLTWIGCASQTPQPPRTAGTPSEPAVHRLPEQFDPQLINGDLLLLQPVFGPADVAVAAWPQTAPASTSPPVVESPASSRQPIAMRTIYRVQVFALSHGEIAEQKRVELEALLGVTVQVSARRGLYLVQAGDFPDPEQANQLKTRLQSMGGDYAEAYVIHNIETSAEAASSADSSRGLPGLDDWIPDPAAADLTPEQPAVAPTPRRMVRAFGWRVLLNKASSYNEAQRLKQRATNQLGRSDVDVTFKAPWYNVEIGYYGAEADAQEALERLKRSFPNALKVRGQIMIPAED